MSSPFTTLNIGDNAQNLAMANELVLAYSERRQVLGQSAVSALSAGDNAQLSTLWLQMQQWQGNNCSYFVDYINGPLNADETGFLYFTVATWRAAAGLNANGFRRKVNMEDDFSYGTVTGGDIRGMWCFEDLQKGFSPLKWIRSNSISDGTFWYRGGTTPDAYPTLAELQTAAETGWDTMGWTEYIPGNNETRYNANQSDYWLASAGWRGSIVSRNFTLIETASNIVPRAIDFYCSVNPPFQVTGGGVFGPLPFKNGVTPALGKIYLVQSVAESSAGSITIPNFFNDTTKPPWHPTGALYGMRYNEGWDLVKYNFTNSNL